METMIHSFTIEPGQAGQRIDKFLSQALPGYSRSYFKNLIQNGLITINQAPAKASSIVKTRDAIAITAMADQKRPLFNPVNTNLGIEIIATHEHFFIINKPANLLVHQTEVPTSCQPTVVDWLLSNHYELVDVGSVERPAFAKAWVGRPGIVHRLDRETSGLLIIARTNFAHMTLSALFKNRAVAKTYLALVEGHPPASGSIDLAIGRDPVHRKKMTTFTNSQSTLSLTKRYAPRVQTTTRTALTHFTVKQYFDNHALVEVKPVTGRTHQIRVHFAAIGHPLVGDYVYGTPSKLINRHALHASSISFSFNGTPFHFEKEIPDDFKRLIQLLQNS